MGQELVEARSGLNTLLVDSIQGLPDVLALGLERRRSQEMVELSRRLGSAQMYVARLGGLQSSLSVLLAHLAMWALLVQSIPLVRSGQIEGAYLAVCTAACGICRIRYWQISDEFSLPFLLLGATQLSQEWGLECSQVITCEPP